MNKAVFIDSETTSPARRPSTFRVAGNVVTLNDVEPLDHAREKTLIALAQNGDPEARHELVLAYQPLIASCARRFIGGSVTVEDLMPMGILGAMRALQTFDSERGLRFSTYARWWIDQSMRDYARKNKADVSFPVYREREERRALPRGATAWPRVFSLDAPLPGDEGRTYADLLAAEHADPEEALAAREETAQLRQALRLARAEIVKRSRKTPNHRELALKQPERFDMIVELRLLADEPMNLRELGQKMGCSFERVRQLEIAFMAQIRDALTGLNKPRPQP